MDDGDMGIEIPEKWSDMLERQKKEREQRRIAEERDKKLNSVLKKKWIWW